MPFNLGGGRSNSSSSGNSFVDPTQAPHLSDIYNRAGEFSNQSTFTGFDPLQRQGQDMAMNAAQGMGGMLNDATGANSFMLNNIMDVNSNPHLKNYANAAINPLKDTLTKDILPQIGKDSIGGNAFSSSRKDLGQNREVEKFMDKAGDITSKIYGDAYGTNLNANQNAISMTPQLASASLMPSQVVSGVGEQNRAMDQEQLLDPMTQLQRYRDLMGPTNILNQQQGNSSSWNLRGGAT